MDISYLFSVLNLYLEKENKDPVIINVTNLNDIIKIDFSYATSLNKTFIKIKKDLFFENINLFIAKIQDNLNILNEEFNNNDYNITLNNNRQLNFKKFSLDDLNLIRSNLKTINNFSFNEIKTKNINYNEIYKENKNQKLSLQMGFSSFITLFLSAIWLLDIFMIALWIFKTLK